MEAKIDVCIVTKEKVCRYHNILRNVPVNNIIIERSTPLGLARMEAIKKVKTEWFAFVDDDVTLTKLWFPKVMNLAKGNTGAVQGTMFVNGLGAKWDASINVFMRAEEVQKLKLGDRGLTHNTLIRTCLVKDWKPSRPDLSAWEDYEITQHILKKGYEWLVTPVEAYHIKSWRKVWSNALWSVENWKKINPKSSWLKKLLKYLLYEFRLCLDWFHLSMPIRARVYYLYLTLAEIWGMIKWW